MPILERLSGLVEGANVDEGLTWLDSAARLTIAAFNEGIEVPDTVWRAVECHRTQMSTYKNLMRVPAKHHRALWSVQEFYRTFSRVNGGRARESDLFEGLR